MAVLRSTAAMTMALAAGCYAPDLRDCVVACASQNDCGPDQICGTDGRCAAPNVAGTCGSNAVIGDAGSGADAAMPRPDAAPDAPPPPDAPTTITLTVQLAGRGSITVVGIGTCGVSIAPCSYQVIPDVARMFVATPAEDWSFDKWQACDGQDATCTYTPSLATTVQAKFRNDD